MRCRTLLWRVPHETQVLEIFVRPGDQIRSGQRLFMYSIWETGWDVTSPICGTVRHIFLDSFPDYKPGLERAFLIETPCPANKDEIIIEQ